MLLLALIVVFTACALPIAAHYPKHTLLLSVPILMWPQPITVGDLPLSPLIITAVLGAVVIGARRHLRRLLPLIVLIGILMSLVLASHLLHGPTQVMAPAEARNHMLSLLLAISLTLAVALAEPERLVALKVLGLSGLLGSGYLFLFGKEAGGRLVLDELNANAAGYIGAVSAVTLVGLFLATRRARWLLGALAPLHLVVWSQSRGGLLALAFGLVVLFTLGRRIVLRASVLAVVVVVVAAGWPLVSRMLADRVLTSRDPAFLETEHRIWLLRLALRLMTEEPVMGIGYGHFLDYSASQLWFARNTHNDWVRIGVEAGLPALALLVTLVVRPMFRRASLEPVGRVLAAVTAVVVTSLGLANTLTDLRVSLPLWISLGLAWSALAHDQRAPAGPPTVANVASRPTAEAVAPPARA